MDTKNLVSFVGISIAVGIGAFILWGPTPRPRKAGRVCGITNLGYTCFLNSLLQALAACPTFICWLKAQDRKKVSSSFTCILTGVIDRINGYSKDLYGDVVPIEIITTLGSLWKFEPGHQDAHELLHVILGALQNEIQFTNRTGCLSDILPITPSNNMSENSASNDVFAHRSASYNDILQSERNESLTEFQTQNKSKSSSIPICDIPINNKPGVILARSSEIITHFVDNESNCDTNGEKILTSSVKYPEKCNAILFHKMPPFSGLLTSQLECTNCNWRSSVRYDKLETVSLPLPPDNEILKWRQHTLSELFSQLVSSEVIHNVECDGCSSRCLAIKTLTLGKLPKCLCLHIIRTTWSTSGMPIKRNDHVIFPEIFVLDPFTFTESIKRNLQIDLPILATNNCSINRAKYKYRLQAVVEHKGPVDAGHFVCYRRGNYSGQWLYTSDSVIENTRLTDVLCANPYLLFYERVINLP